MMNNIRGYKTKENVIKRIIEEENPVIIGLVETKLNKDDQVTIPGYITAPVSRDEEGGGVLIAYKQCLKKITVITKEYKENNAEMIWIRINNNKIKIRIGLIYMPQESRTKVDKLQMIYKAMKEQIKEAMDNGESVVVCGDMNCKVGTIIQGNNPTISKGGRLLMKLADETNLKMVNAEEVCEGLWTREEGEEKSILDYVMVFQRDIQAVNSMQIDNNKNITPYSTQINNNETQRTYSDHHMISVKINWEMNIVKKDEKIQILDQEGMNKFQETLDERKISNLIDEKDIRKSYTKWSKQILAIREKCSKKVKVRKMWKVNRELTTAKKRIKRLLRNRDLTRDEVEGLKNRRKVILTLIEDEERIKEYSRITRIVEEVQKDGGVNSTTFWKVLRKIRGKQRDLPHVILDKNGKKCEDPEDIKRAHVEWYQELLTTKEGVTTEEKEVEEINRIRWKSMQVIANTTPPRFTTIEKVEQVIKDLDTKKAKDASTWKNNIIKGGGREMSESILKICNQVDKQGKIPREWEKMTIIATHKKGKKELMSNKRGLFITDNVSKVYERIIKNRNDEKFREGITEWNTGGIKNRSTVDNIMIANAVIENNKYYNRNTYMTFTDAEKCFDKLWLLDGVGDLWKCGMDVRDCVMIKKLNERAEVTVKTPVGETTSFELIDTARQGTVSGPPICIASMNSINTCGKDITTNYSPDYTIKATTFVDDITSAGGFTVASNTIANCRLLEERKKMTFNNKNGKTEYMIVVGNNKEEIRTVTNEVEKGRIERVYEHKMLGSWMDETGEYEINITKRSEKIPFMISTIRNQASSKTVGKLAVESRLNLVEVVIIPSILHNIEGHTTITKKEMQQLEGAQHQILTGVLELPRATPYKALLMELGCWTMKARISYRKLMLYHNIQRSDDKRVVKRLTEIQKEWSRETTWYKGVERDLKKYGIEMKAGETKKSKWKKHVKRKINNITASEIREEIKEMTKSRTVRNKEFKRANYVNETTIQEVKKILKSRLHMTKLPGNLKQLGIEECPLCHQKSTSTEHYFECGKCWVLARKSEVTKEDLNSTETGKLSDVANFLEKVEVMLEPIMSRAAEHNKIKSIEKKDRKRKTEQLVETEEKKIKIENVRRRKTNCKRKYPKKTK